MDGKHWWLAADFFYFIIGNFPPVNCLLPPAWPPHSITCYQINWVPTTEFSGQHTPPAPPRKHNNAAMCGEIVRWTPQISLFGVLLFSTHLLVALVGCRFWRAWLFHVMFGTNIPAKKTNEPIGCVMNVQKFSYFFMCSTTDYPQFRRSRMTALYEW